MKKITISLIFIIIFFILPIKNVSADIVKELSDLDQQIIEFLDSTNDNIIIIQGSHCSTIEHITFEYLKEKYDTISKNPLILDTELELNNKINETIILIGGPKQNYITREILNIQEYNIEQINVSIGFFTGIVSFITSDEEKIGIIFSDLAGYYNTPRTSANKSPLAIFIPVAYIPLVATGISFLLLWLGNIIFKFGHKPTRYLLAGKLMSRLKKKKISSQFIGFTIKGVRIKLREWISIISAAIIFALSISYTYFVNKPGIFLFISLNIGSNAIIYSIRNLTRLIMDKHQGIHTEYVFWYFGAIITLASGWLGNTFSLAGYTIANEETVSNKLARNEYLINIITFIAGMIFFIWNLYYPCTFAQMASILAISLAFIQMLPIHPFVGKVIKTWKNRLWKITFAFILIFYVIIVILIM